MGSSVFRRSLLEGSCPRTERGFCTWWADESSMGQWQCLEVLSLCPGAAADAVTALVRLFPLSLPLLCSAGLSQLKLKDFHCAAPDCCLPVMPNSRAGGSEDVDKYFLRAEFTLLVISRAFQGQNMDLELNPWLLLCCKLSLKPLWTPRPFWSFKVKQSLSPLHVNTGRIRQSKPQL